jgi:hypothetical protein
MGHSASSVGRTRYNYAAQPGDGVPPERRMGIWDKFAVYWGYRPIPRRDAAEELPTLNRGSSSARTSRGSASPPRSSAWTSSGIRTA